MRYGKHLVFQGRDFKVFLSLSAESKLLEVEMLDGRSIPSSDPRFYEGLRLAMMNLFIERNKLQELIVKEGVGGRTECKGHGCNDCGEDHNPE